MKWDDIPDAVLDMQAVHPPVKLVVDNDALFDMLMQQKWMLIQTNPHEDTPQGNAMIKAFNCHVRITKKMRLLTKKLSTDTWVVTLKPGKLTTVRNTK